MAPLTGVDLILFVLLASGAGITPVAIATIFGYLWIPGAPQAEPGSTVDWLRIHCGFAVLWMLAEDLLIQNIFRNIIWIHLDK